MLVMYSKKTGDIKSVISGSSATTIKEIFPYDYEDYELIYDTLIIDDDGLVINNPSFFYVENSAIFMKNTNLEKYTRR